MKKHATRKKEPRSIWLIGLLLLAAGCSGSEEAGDGGNTGDGGVGDGEPAPAECIPASADPQEVELQTDDGLTLHAGLSLAGKASAPAAILLHMRPPENDRNNFPPALIAALIGRGVTVLNVDRRGAGQSQGNPVEAYEGPNGKLDVKAAHDFLRAHACPVDPERIVVVGASNGTTTAVDFTLLAASKAVIARPAGLVLISAGDYTDNQTSIIVHKALFEKIGILFLYSAAEAAWHETPEKNHPATWKFWEYEGSDHGTALLASHPETIDMIASFAVNANKPE